MNSGWVVLRWKGDGKGSLYEVQSCTGDPTVEANWTYLGSFSGGRAELKGFTPGTLLCGAGSARSAPAAGATPRRSGWCEGRVTNNLVAGD
jgi:hypothetical protein